MEVYFFPFFVILHFSVLDNRNIPLIGFFIGFLLFKPKFFLEKDEKVVKKDSPQSKVQFRVRKACSHLLLLSTD